MTESQKCIDFIKQQENMLLYLNRGMSSPRWDPIGECWDIGYGTRFYPDGTIVTSTDDPITEEKATEYLKYYVDKCCARLSAAITGDLNQSQFDSLISIAYNEGIVPISTSLLLKYVDNNPDDLINIQLQFRRWKYSKGKVINGLLIRRNAEFQMYISELDLTLPIYSDYVQWVKIN